MFQGDCHDLDSSAEFFGNDLAFYQNSSISCIISFFLLFYVSYFNTLGWLTGRASGL